MSETGQPIPALLNRAMMLVQQRRYSEAENYSRQALAAAPEHDWALHLLAVSIAGQDNREHEALHAIERAIAAAPNSAFHHARKASIVLHTHGPRMARASAEEAVRLDPDDAFARRLLAITFLAGGEQAKAERVAREALALDSDDADTASVLARAMRAQNKTEGLQEISAMMLMRDPDQAESHLLAGWAALDANQRTTAEEHFLTALRLHANDGEARQGLVETFRRRSPFYAWVSRVNRWPVLSPAYWKLREWLIILSMLIVFPALLVLPNAPTWWQGLSGIGVVAAIVVFLAILIRASIYALASLSLWLDPRARLCLSSQEKLEVGAILGGIGIALVILIINAVS